MIKGKVNGQNGWWHVVRGKVTFDNTVAKNSKGWWHVQNGKVNFNSNTVAKNSNGWWYIKNGKVDFSYTGLASNQNGVWYIRNGKVDFNASRKVKHTHKWRAHKATKQVWVPNIVTVDDYEVQTIPGARFYTQNGDGSYTANGPTYWIENGFTWDDLKEIIEHAMKNADSNGLYNGVYYGNYQNVTKTKRVKTGSHKEDRGHYEKQSYTDYYKCSSCGARKSA